MSEIKQSADELLII